MGVYELDRSLAERARQVVWDHSVRLKDAVYVATALDAEVEQLEHLRRGPREAFGENRGSAARHWAGQRAGVALSSGRPKLLSYRDNMPAPWR